MIRLVCLLKRKPGTSHEEFLDYWENTHAPLVLGTRSGSHVRRYERHPSAAPGGFDGVTEQWFDSVESFYASIAEDDYTLIEEDIPKFLDPSALQFVLVHET